MMVRALVPVRSFNFSHALLLVEKLPVHRVGHFNRGSRETALLKVREEGFGRDRSSQLSSTSWVVRSQHIDTKNQCSADLLWVACSRQKVLEHLLASFSPQTPTTHERQGWGTPQGVWSGRLVCFERQTDKANKTRFLRGRVTRAWAKSKDIRSSEHTESRQQ